MDYTKKWWTCKQKVQVGISCSGGEFELQVKYQAAHHQLVASALAVKVCHENIPDAKIGCMLAAGTTYLYTPNPNDVLESIRKDRESYFFTDVQVRGYYPIYSNRFFEENGTLDRYRKKSFFWYKDVIQSNGEILGRKCHDCR